jgi:hypothetical protein
VNSRGRPRARDPGALNNSGVRFRGAQVNFFDDTEVLLWADRRWVTFKGKGKARRTYDVADVLAVPDLAKRIKVPRPAPPCPRNRARAHTHARPAPALLLLPNACRGGAAPRASCAPAPNEGERRGRRPKGGAGVVAWWRGRCCGGPCTRARTAACTPGCARVCMR